MKARLALASALVVAAALSVVPSGADTNVTVIVSVAYTRASGTQSVAGAACPVSVPQGSDGVVVLEAAKTEGCISSYTLQHFSFGDFVQCISAVCSQQFPSGVALWYWAIHLNAAYTDYGVDGYRAADRDWLLFSYEAFPCVPFGC